MKKTFLILAAGAGRRLARLFCGMMGERRTRNEKKDISSFLNYEFIFN